MIKPTASLSLVGNGQLDSSTDQASLNEGLTDIAHGCAIDKLLPPKPPSFLSTSKRAAGYAAESLVLCDLLAQGYQAFPTLPDMPYDICVDLGFRFVRLQVKSTRGPTDFCPDRIGSTYRWITRPGKSKVYDDNAFDMLALVAMDIRQIAYISTNGKILQTYKLSAPGTETPFHKKALNIDQYPFSQALSSLTNKKSA